MAPCGLSPILLSKIFVFCADNILLDILPSIFQSSPILVQADPVNRHQSKYLNVTTQASYISP